MAFERVNRDLGMPAVPDLSISHSVLQTGAFFCPGWNWRHIQFDREWGAEIFNNGLTGVNNRIEFRIPDNRWKMGGPDVRRQEPEPPRFAGSIGRHFMKRGMPVGVLDADGPVAGLRGVFKLGEGENISKVPTRLGYAI